MNIEQETVTIKITVNGKIYTIACAAGEEKELKAATALLDQAINEARQNNRSSVISDERLMMVAALNISHQLYKQQKRRQQEEKAMAQRIYATSQHLEKRTAETATAANVNKDFVTAL